MPSFLPPLSAESTQPNLYNMYRQGYVHNAAAEAFANVQRGPSDAPPVDTDMHRNWLINTPIFDFTANRTLDTGYQQQSEQTEAPSERKDSMFSVPSLDQIQDKPYPGAVDLDYERLRRSFGSATDLTPPPVANFANASSTDPKKRQLPASSPLPSAKRIRLSLPGEDQTSDTAPIEAGDDRAGATSSPSKMMSQAAQTSSERPMAEMEHVQPAPAPNLAPTAVMYRPSDQRSSTKEDYAAYAVPELPEMTDIGSLAVEEDDNPFSDIEWGDLINEDMV